MMQRVWSAIQAMVEYGAAAGNQAVAAPQAKGAGRVTAWAAENQTVLIAGAAALLLFWLVRASRRA